MFSFFKKPLRYIEEFIRSQGDRIFLFFLFLTPISTFYFFYKSLGLNELIQFLIVEGTFFTVIYSVLIKDNFSKYRDRPKIDVNFDDSNSHCYYATPLYDTVLTPEGTVAGSFLTYYVSVEVINKGRTKLDDVEVVLQRVESKDPLANSFLPLNLAWLFKHEKIEIPPHGMFRLINIIEVREPQGTRKLLDKIVAAGGGQDKDRYSQLAVGFRACNEDKPFTLSDIFSKGEHTFHLVVTASNAEPKPIKMQITYDGDWNESTPIEDMRRTHLKVNLLKQYE